MIVNLLIIGLVLISALLICMYRYFFPPIPAIKKHYTYALLLGCPSHDDGTYSSSQIHRCDLAIKAYQNGLYDTLIISGGAVKNKYVESLEMQRYIQNQIHIPTLCETESQNTWENFANSKDLVGDASILILSSGTHIRRACAIARSFLSDYGGLSYPDHKPRHIFREIVSRWIYITIEVKKKLR